MSSPAKDLPKIADQLKGEILAERSLKPTEAQEKNVLPSADDVKQEKNHQNIMTGTDSQTVRQSNKLTDGRRNITLICLHCSGITGFKSDSLKPTETVEKVVLPGKEEIKTEKTIKGVLDGVKGFESETLKNVKTKEPASPIAVAQVCMILD